MSKEKSTWHSDRVGRELTLVRYGHLGRPVLIFPTAAGDAEECERFLLTDALGPLMAAERIKSYSVDSIAGMVWLQEDNSYAGGSQAQENFLAAVVEEVVPAIRQDCGDDEVEIIAAGASIGAFNALLAICRYPEIFSHAICMSGTYDLSKFLEGPPTEVTQRISPLQLLPDMPEGAQLEKLRERFVLLTHGEGRWEDPNQSWMAANALGKRGVPNRVDPWDEEWDHDWPTWRNMLPKYLDELLDEPS